MTDFTLDTIDKAWRDSCALVPKKIATPRGAYILLCDGTLDDETLARLEEKLSAPTGAAYYVTPIPFEQMWQLKMAGRADLPRKMKKAARGFLPWRLRERVKRQALARCKG